MGNLAGWPYWKVISLTGQAGAGTDYQAELSIGDSAGGNFHLEGHCDVFPQDVRITDDDGTTLLDHWVEDLTADPIMVHVKVNDNLSSNQDIRVYYGKSGETTASSIQDTFILGDDFADGDYTSNPVWTVGSGTWSAADYYLKKTSAAAWDDISTPSTSAVAVWEYKAANVGSQQFFFMSSTTNPGTTNGYFVYLADSPDRIILYKSTGGVHFAYEAVNTAFDGNFHNLKITRDSSDEIKIYYDGVLKITRTETSFSTSSYIVQRVHTQNTGQIDDIRTRKYNSPEPAFSSAGAEQTPGWTGKVLGVINPAKINDIDVANITKVMNI